ncbi:alpha/beta hydrolase [Desulfococcaceae bacterium HSG8]|nr:alpha/beta hydrolase [Desulfococcaceae bacterium HSG8]
MPFTEVGGKTIFFSHSTSESDRNLLLIHGSGGDHMHWPYQLRRLPGINVCAVDLPGHGKSGGHGHNNVEDYADFINSFVSELNFDKVSLAGHSLGGAIVQCLALRSPKWLSRIILVGTGARLRVAPAILEGILSDFQGTTDLICNEYAYGPAASPSLIDAGRKALSKVHPPLLLGDYTACDQFDVMEKIKGLTLPTSVICGSADKLTPVKYSEYLHRHIRGSAISIIEGAGHMVGLEKHEEFTESIGRFLTN